MNRRTRIALSASLALGLVAASAALPAYAEGSPSGSNIHWYWVDDSYPTISDAQSAYPDLLGSGVDLPFGWTGDAFDGFLSSVSIDGTSIEWTGAGENWVDGGLSRVDYVGTATDFDPAFQIAATLELQGNYARWTFTPQAGPTGTLQFNGNLGSDGYQSAVVVTANSAVVSSDDNSADPVIGYWFSGANGTLDVPDTTASDYVYWTASTTAPAVAVVALQDYAPCAEETAVSEMVARVASLNSSFGQPIEGALECATVTAPAALSIGSATSQTLAVSVDPAVDAWLAAPWWFSARPAYLSDPSVVESAFVGAPAGLDLAFDAVTSEVTVTGAPTVSGDFDVALVLYLTDVEGYSSGDAANGFPLVAHFTVSVAAPALADTGLSAATPALAAFGGLLVLAGAGALGMRRRLIRG